MNSLRRAAVALWVCNYASERRVQVYIPPFVAGLVVGIGVTFLGFAMWGMWLNKKGV